MKEGPKREMYQPPNRELDSIETIYFALIANGSIPGVDTMREAHLIYDKEHHPEKFDFKKIA